MNSEINKYIYGLEYDTAQLLAIPGATMTKTLPYKASTEGTDFIICKYEPKKIDSELYDITLLNAMEGVIYPGATVRVNRDFAESRPAPVTLKRAPLSLSINLPGLEDEGVIRVEEPTIGTVQAAVNKSIDSWLTNGKGYTVASRQTFIKTDMYSSSQTALDLDLNLSWLTSDLKNHLSVKSDGSKACVIAMYKQVFYSVAVDAPTTPSDLFHESVTLEDVQTLINDKNPLGYVRSVDYGRICFVKIESSNSDLKGDIHSFLTATKSGVTVTADITASYHKINKESTITVISLGGNASVAANVVTSADVSELMSLIGGHAEFKKDNPGIALSYTTAFAKDNSVALVSSTTNYVEKTYEIFKSTHVQLEHKGGYIAECCFSYREKTIDPEGNMVILPEKQFGTGSITAPRVIDWTFSGACFDFRVDAGSMDGLLWSKWHGRRSWRQNGIATGLAGSKIKVHFSGTSLSPKNSITAS